MVAAPESYRTRSIAEAVWLAPRREARQGGQSAHDRRIVPDQGSADRLAGRRVLALGYVVDADPANNPVNWQWVAGLCPTLGTGIGRPAGGYGSPALEGGTFSRRCLSHAHHGSFIRPSTSRCLSWLQKPALAVLAGCKVAVRSFGSRALTLYNHRHRGAIAQRARK